LIIRGLFVEKKILIIDNFIGKSKKYSIQSERLAGLLEVGGWQVRTASYRKNRILRLFDVCMKCLRVSDYSVALISVYSGLYFWLVGIAVLIMRVLNKPYVLMLHGGNLPDFAKRHLRRVRPVFGSAVAIAAPSEYLRQSMKAYSKKDILVIPNGLDIEKYPVRLRRIVSPDLVWLRSFHKIYNPQLAVGVVALLKTDFPDIHMRMIGPDKDGSYGQVIKEMERLGVSERIELIPGVDKREVPLRLDQGDIFINTTNIDNTPVSVIEAMACGLCIVSTNVGGIPYLLEDGVDALLVPPDDARAMADAVRRILTNLELAERLSRAARQKAEGFNWPPVFKKWEGLLSEIVSEEKGFHG
jgi:glycosyltransferase involved in cell wall biosynthesis